ncbi:MAG: SMC-Scp complex subunit ScpB [Candidatus Moranbacteria bacterium]|nr:SMC-Scp complex subunit ScpB [Candidatus Moranbacteria bacterium]
MELEKIMSAVESILFVSGEPIKLARLLKVLDFEKADVEKSLESLREKYAGPQSGLMLIYKGDEIQLASRAENAQFVEQLVKSELQDSLSVAALEVVSIIAYRGPISKPEIEAIRGVNCNYTLRNLLLRGLIERSDNPRDSRGYVYGISFECLKILGVEDVKKLPNYATLSTDERVNLIVPQNTK